MRQGCYDDCRAARSRKCNWWKNNTSVGAWLPINLFTVKSRRNKTLGKRGLPICKGNFKTAISIFHFCEISLFSVKSEITTFNVQNSLFKLWTSKFLQDCLKLISAWCLFFSILMDFLPKTISGYTTHHPSTAFTISMRFNYLNLTH